MPRSIARLAAALSLVLGLSACAAPATLEPPVPLGDFALGLNIVVTDKMQRVPISREASAEEWETAMKAAIADRFGRYDGGRLYNFGISIDAYALAPPGVPLVAAPKSVLVITANVWDDATATKLNAEGKQLTIWEGMSGETVIGSGLTRSRAEQMRVLTANAAKAVQDWLLEHPGWLATPPIPDPAPPSPAKP